MYEVLIHGKVVARGFKTYGAANQWHDEWVDNWFGIYGLDEEPPQAIIRQVSA